MCSFIFHNPGGTDVECTNLTEERADLNFGLVDRLPKVDIKDFKSIPAVEKALPTAVFGNGTCDEKMMILTRGARLK